MTRLLASSHMDYILATASPVEELVLHLHVLELANDLSCQLECLWTESMVNKAGLTGETVKEKQ